MPATATGRGAQVIVDPASDTERAIRGTYAATFEGNARKVVDDIAAGLISDGNTASALRDFVVMPPTSGLRAATVSGPVSRYNNARVNAVMTTPPTITVNTTHNATLTTSYGWNGGPGGGSIYAPPTGQGPFNYYGGLPTTSGFGALNLPAATYGLNNYTSVVMRMQTNIDATIAEFEMFQGTPNAVIRVIVDGQYASLTATPITAVTGNFNYVVLDFTAAGGRKMRNVIIEAYNVLFGSIMAVGATGTLQKPGGRVGRIYVTGDSFTVGGASVVFNCFPGILGDYLGIRDTWTGGVPGTGYLANASGTALTMRQRLSDYVAAAPLDLMIITAGFNDVSMSLPALQAEVRATVLAIHGTPALANVPIIVCPQGGNHSTALSIPAEQAIQAGVTAANDPLVYFIPTVSGPNGPWMTGNGYVGNTTGNGNCDIYISSDGTHPSDAGHAYIASRMYDEIVRIAG